MPIALRGPGASAPPVVMNAPAPLWRWRPDALLAAAVILPLVILGACAWIAWTDAWRSTERELASDADAVAEYASRVLEGHRLAGEFANHLLRGLSDDDIRERAAELHRELNTMLPSLAGVTTIAVLDREAEIMILANLFPVPPGIRVPDREWMRALSGPAAPPLHISALTTGRIDGNLFFSVSQRRTGAGNGRPEGAFDGVISVSVDPVRLSAGLAQISGEHDNVAALVRDDGAVLARSSGVPGLLPQIPEDSPLRTAARDGVARGSYMGRALGPEREVGESRLIAFRRVAGLPVYATVGRPTPMILARWRGVVASQLVIGLPAWFAFIALAWMLRAGQRALAAANAQLERRVEERTAALRLGEAQLRVAQLAARIGTWVLDPDTGEVAWSDEQYALFGLSQERDGGMTYARFLDEVVHPDDRETVAAIGADAFASGELDADFRVWQRLPDGQRRVRWVTGRGRRVPGPDGKGRLFGVNVDITERKDSEERQQLLMHEVDHRAKNVLAVVQAALRMTPKDDPHAYANAVQGRVAALARAHVLLAERRWAGASLQDLVASEVATLHPGGEAPPPDVAMPRVEAHGPEVTLAPPAAQALSMALHELATNATKYGALSVASGHLSVTWDVDPASGLLDLRWVETGGPPIAAVPERRGFGSRVIEAAIRDQLGGRFDRQWRATGLAFVIALPLAGPALRS
ncbi:HWE histidine kinase domain-containing protein [Plastoroseomonas arctica]|uniref:histidine kinase n=1 Tax=Plastoroseomonas arctica TaxID=1509237 RepID=A0AAF1JVC2_9PROT|nr:HWE histidine kinase domain-containing protein [Plastoroseomonas arctica]MBR0653912.1 hypothetical protein [Plastoroseomonas arctica]